MDMEAQILEIIRDMLASRFELKLSIKDITGWFIDRHGMEYERKITTKWIGIIVRKRLNLKTQKRHGVCVIPLTERPKLERLFERYGITVKEAEEPECGEENPYDPSG
jgi:hypothetical protein